jgi:hypothetical protein
MTENPDLTVDLVVGAHGGGTRWVELVRLRRSVLRVSQLQEP